MTKNAVRKLIASAAMLVLSSCSLATSPTLPNQQNSIPEGFTITSGTSMPLGDTWLSFEYHQKGEDTCLLLKLKPDTLPKGCKLRLSLSGEPYNTARGKKWQHDFSTLHKAGEYIFLLRKSDFPQEGGPYDYRVVFTLLSADGKALDSRDNRLDHFVPGPGWEASFEKENQEELQKLQQAATRCAHMRLQMIYHIYRSDDSPVELPLHQADMEKLRHLIGRMRPVCTHLHEAMYGYHLQLVMLDAEGKELASMDPYDVTREQHVSPENLADLSSFALSNDDADTWFNIINSPEVNEVIESSARKPGKKQKTK